MFCWLTDKSYKIEMLGICGKGFSSGDWLYCGRVVMCLRVTGDITQKVVFGTLMFKNHPKSYIII